MGGTPSVLGLDLSMYLHKRYDLGESHFLADGALVWLEDQNFRHIVICYKMHKQLLTTHSS
jgi:hypothetical protein